MIHFEKWREENVVGGDLERVWPRQVTTAVGEKKKCMMACNVHLWRKESEEHEGWEGEIMTYVENLTSPLI